MSRMLALAVFLLAGCAESQVMLDDARAGIREAGEGVQHMHDTIFANCEDPPSDFCKKLIEYFNQINAGYRRANHSIP